jgi:hypothetical protein
LLAVEEPQLRRLGDLIDGDAGDCRGAQHSAAAALGTALGSLLAQGRAFCKTARGSPLPRVLTAEADGHERTACHRHNSGRKARYGSPNDTNNAEFASSICNGHAQIDPFGVPHLVSTATATAEVAAISELE